MHSSEKLNFSRIQLKIEIFCTWLICTFRCNSQYKFLLFHAAHDGQRVFMYIPVSIANFRSMQQRVVIWEPSIYFSRNSKQLQFSFIIPDAAAALFRAQRKASFQTNKCWIWCPYTFHGQSFFSPLSGWCLRRVHTATKFRIRRAVKQYFAVKLTHLGTCSHLSKKIFIKELEWLLIMASFFIGQHRK